MRGMSKLRHDARLPGCQPTRVKVSRNLIVKAACRATAFIARESHHVKRGSAAPCAEKYLVGGVGLKRSALQKTKKKLKKI